MPEYLRVTQKDTGHELTISQSMYDFAPSAYDKLDDPATGPDSEPLPPKYATKKAAAAKKES